MLSRFIVLAIFLLTTPTLAATWEYVALSGINTTCLETDPVHERIFVGTIAGLFIHDLQTGDWIDRHEAGWIGRHVHSLDWHPDLPSRIIAGRENAWFKGYVDYTDNLGESWTIAYNSDGGGVTDLAHDDLFYYACTWSDISPGEFLRSADGGESWTLITGTGHYVMTSIAISHEGTLYLGGDAPLTCSFDLGLTWVPAAGDLPPGYGIYCLDIPPPGEAMPEVDLFASIDLGLYHTFDTVIWTQVLPDACRNIASYPVHGGPIAAVTFDGRVMVSRNGGQDWIDETGDLPGIPLDVTFTTYNRALWVNTVEDGVFRVEQIVTGVEPPPVPLGDLTLDAWPNPFNPLTHLEYRLPADGRVVVSVFDLSGRKVDTLLDGVQAAGPHTLAWDATALPSGVYLVRLIHGNESRNVRAVLVK